MVTSVSQDVLSTHTKENEEELLVTDDDMSGDDTSDDNEDEENVIQIPNEIEEEDVNEALEDTIEDNRKEVFEMTFAARYPT